MTSVYADQLEHAERTVRLIPSGEVLIVDVLKGLKPGSSVQWQMVSFGTPADPDGNTLKLTKDDKSLTLDVLAPKSVEWKVLDSATPKTNGTRLIVVPACRRSRPLLPSRANCLLPFWQRPARAKIRCAR